MALDAKYHLACLAGLRNRHRSFIRQNQDSHSSHTEDMKTQARAFVELITYVENAVEITKCDHEGDALILMKAARIVCEEIFKSKGFNFNGSFPSDCQQESLPTTLKSLVTMLLRGADLMDQDSADSQACLSVSQTILFNCKKPK